MGKLLRLRTVRALRKVLLMIDYTQQVKQSGGSRSVWSCLVENRAVTIPAQRGTGVVFSDSIKLVVTFLKNTFPRHREGYAGCILRTLAACHRLSHLLISLSKLRIFDGSFHDVDSSVLAFEIAGSMVRFGKLLLRQADPALLEPIMKVEVVTPEDYMGDVIGDLNKSSWTAL